MAAVRESERGLIVKVRRHMLREKNQLAGILKQSKAIFRSCDFTTITSAAVADVVAVAVADVVEVVVPDDDLCSPLLLLLLI